MPRSRRGQLFSGSERREAAGQGEVHVQDADVIYVLDGSATFVTGGALVEPHETAPGEIRGRGIEGTGEAHRHDPGAGAPGQLRLGRRRREDPLHDRADEPLPDPPEGTRHPAVRSLG